MSSLVCPKCGTLSVGRSKDEDGLRTHIAELEAAQGRWSEKYAALHARFAQQQTKLEKAEAALVDQRKEVVAVLQTLAVDMESALAERDQMLRLACRMITKVAEWGIRRWGPVCAGEMAVNPLGSDMDDKVTAEEWMRIRVEQLLDDVLPADIRALSTEEEPKQVIYHLTSETARAEEGSGT